MFRRQIYHILPQGQRAAGLSTTSASLLPSSVFAVSSSPAPSTPQFAHPLMSHIFAKLKSYQTESNNGKVVISKEEHEEIRTFLKEFAGKTELNELRSLYRSTNCVLELSLSDCETFIDKHIQKGDLTGAFQWFLTYSARHPEAVAHSAAMHNQLLAALSAQRSLDEFFYLYHSMKKHHIPLQVSTFAQILTSSMLYPQSKWSWIRQALLDNLPRMVTEASSSPEQLAAVQEVVLRSFELFSSMHRPDIVRDLHIFVQQHLPTAASIDTLTVLGVSAVQLRDTVLLTSVLSQLLPHIAQADSQAPRDVIQQVKSSLLLTEKVNNAELVAAGLLTGLYLRRADGKQSAWTAQNLQQAGQLWSAVSSKSVIDAQSYASLLKTLLNGLDDNVATKKSLEPSFVLTTFLTDNLLNGGWTEQQVALTLSEAGVSVLDKIIDHYTAVKDVDHISTLLFLSMKHGVTISEFTLVKVFELLQQQNEHKLVMELFELHLKHSDQLAAQRKQGNKSKKFAPRIFGTAIHSLVELGEVDLMLNFLRYEIPRRGYYLKNAFYNEAIHGLKRQGRFQEAVALFFEAHDVIIRQNQLISANHKSSKLRKAHVTMHTDGNVYTDIKLLTAALQCCSKGRLGREAVTILYSFQQMEDKKGLDTDTSDVMRLFEYGIIALATADHVDKLPSLLLSLEKMHRPLISSKRLLRVAYAAAISMNNQDVAANILSQFQKTYGPHAAISYKGIEGVKEIVMQDLEVGWTEAMADLHIQVELR